MYNIHSSNLLSSYSLSSSSGGSFPIPTAHIEAVDLL